MQVMVQVPRAFSVREENELYAFQHLLARMNPQLRVANVTTGVHVNGGCTVFWGLVYAEGQIPSREDVLGALEDAGFDLKRNRLLAAVDLAALLGTTAERPSQGSAA